MKKNTFSLTALRLRFECEAQTAIQLGGLKAGSNLRGALVNVMRRATCSAYPNAALGAAPGIDPEHAKTCPVCWLVAANDHPGEERRGYTLTPPTPLHGPMNTGPQNLGSEVRLSPGARFSFHLTLFGDAARYLPYFVLAVPEAGRLGMGPGRGQFTLKSVWGERPGLAAEAVLAEGQNSVHPPQQVITHADILQQQETLAKTVNPEMWMEFLSPLRLILNDKLLKSPDFGVFFALLLKRLDDLAAQYAGGAERPAAEREQLWELANRVRLVESQTQWVEVQSGSSRTGQKTWLSGLLGPARYSASPEVWRELLPWLLWGEVAQVGKDTVKGNGVFRMRNEER